MPAPPAPPKPPPRGSLRPLREEAAHADEAFEGAAPTEIAPNAGAEMLDFLKLPGAAGASGQGGAPAEAAQRPRFSRTIADGSGTIPAVDPAPAASARPSAGSMPAGPDRPAWSQASTARLDDAVGGAGLATGGRSAALPRQTLVTRVLDAHPASLAVAGIGLAALGVGAFLASRTPPPPPAPPPPPPPAAFAFVSSEPRGARVLLDGQLKVLETPAVMRVPAGPAMLIFEKEGFEARIVTITGKPGEARLVDEKLRPVTPAPPASPPPTETAGVAPDAEEPAPKPKRKSGRTHKKKHSSSSGHKRHR